jgi:hypothetical protein
MFVHRSFAVTFALALGVGAGCGSSSATPAPAPEEKPEPIAPSAPATEQWKRFSSTAGKFTVLFPGTPKETSKTSGPITFYTTDFTQEIEGPDTEFIVVYAEVPVAKSKDVFDGFNKGVASTGRVLTSRDIKLEKYPGKETTVAVTEDGITVTVQARTYTVDDRFYAVVSAGPDADKQKFFDSFALVTR